MFFDLTQANFVDSARLNQLISLEMLRQALFDILSAAIDFNMANFYTADCSGNYLAIKRIIEGHC